MHQPPLLFKNKLYLHLSDRLLRGLRELTEKSRNDLYIVGGTVRDYLLDRDSLDLDLAVRGSALDCARMLRAILGGGTLVDLSGPQDEAVRLVFQGEQLDFAAFRQGAGTIEQDLLLRDFSINAMAVSLREALLGQPYVLIDPAGGRSDLLAGRVVHLPGAFTEDPVRMVRAYRMCATLGFTLDQATLAAIHQHAHLVLSVAAERVHFELGKIFDSSRTCGIVKSMDEAGLLVHIFPELYLGRGVAQPDFHHLDVFDHSLETLAKLEAIFSRPQLYFTDHQEAIAEYLESKNNCSCLKYAALFHDLGKPTTRGSADAEKSRVTFYGHDEEGKKVSKAIANRLKWSYYATARVADLVGMHMHPFHLCNVQRDGVLSSRAVVKLCRRAGKDLIGLFLLAMADSLASEGKLKPPQMEAEILFLFNKVVVLYNEMIEPVVKGPRLITGTDLIREFQLVPGPLFGEILEELEIARIEGRVQDRQVALSWVAEYLSRKLFDEDR